MDFIMKKVLIIENHTKDFYNSRLPLAYYLFNKGWEVHALVPLDENEYFIEKSKIKILNYKFQRGDKGIIQLIRLFKIYFKIIKENEYDIIHSFRFQPNLINVLVNLFNKNKVIIHITGLGIVFSKKSFFNSILKFISIIIYQLKILRSDRIILQNDDDMNDIVLNNNQKRKFHVVYGSGVDTELFNPTHFNKDHLRRKFKIKSGELVFICVTRLIVEKGINYLIDGFSEFYLSNKKVKLLIVGDVDKDNPNSISKNYINKWNNKNNIFFLGQRDDIKDLLALSDVFIFPSFYREGIPRVILEALSMGLPIITTNMPGCKLTVQNGKNGYLIKPRSKNAIIKSMQSLKKLNFENIRSISRNKSIRAFSQKKIFEEIENIYHL